MSFKDAIKDTIKIGGCMGALVVSGGIVAMKAYRRGYLDAYDRITDLINNAIEKEMGEEK